MLTHSFSVKKAAAPKILKGTKSHGRKRRRFHLLKRNVRFGKAKLQTVERYNDVDKPFVFYTTRELRVMKVAARVEATRIFEEECGIDGSTTSSKTSFCSVLTRPFSSNQDDKAMSAHNFRLLLQWFAKEDTHRGLERRICPEIGECVVHTRRDTRQLVLSLYKLAAAEEDDVVSDDHVQEIAQVYKAATDASRRYALLLAQADEETLENDNDDDVSVLNSLLSINDENQDLVINDENQDPVIANPFTPAKSKIVSRAVVSPGTPPSLILE